MLRSFICICLVAFVACSEVQRSEDVLSQDEMTQLLLNVYIAEVKVGEYAPKIGRDSAYQVFELVKRDLLDSMAIAPEAFEESLEYYYQRPDELDIIYARVIDSLNLKLQRYAEPAASVDN